MVRAQSQNQLFDFQKNLWYIFSIRKYTLFLYGGGRVREHKQIKEFAVEDIIRLVRQTDLSNLNTFLVLNGGTGVGKTTAIMNNVL